MTTHCGHLCSFDVGKLQSVTHRSARTRVSYYLNQLVPIFGKLVPVVKSTPYKSTRTQFGQLVPSLVSSYLVWLTPPL